MHQPHGWQMVEQELARTSQNDLILRLDESERRKSLILGTLAEGLVLQDAEGRIESWNPAAERVLGLTADELSGRTIVALAEWKPPA